MLAVLISSYVSNYVAPVSVHATWALSRARSELLVALLERLLHVVRAPFCVVEHAIGSLLAELPGGVKPVECNGVRGRGDGPRARNGG